METTTATPPGAQYGPGTAGAPVRRLTRKHGSLSGVAGGFADYAGIDPTLVRLGLVAGTILTFPLVPIAYVAAWAIMPEDGTVPATAGSPPPPRPTDVPFNPVPPAPGASQATNPMTEAADAAEAMAKARAEVEAVDRAVPPVGPAPRPADQADG